MFGLSLNCQSTNPSKTLNLCRRRRKCHSRLPAHTIFWSKSHFTTVISIKKEVETFWQLIKDLGIMLDMNLSIANDVDSNTYRFLSIDFSNFNDVRAVEKCHALSQTMKISNDILGEIDVIDINNENVLSLCSVESWIFDFYFCFWPWACDKLSTIVLNAHVMR